MNSIKYTSDGRKVVVVGKLNAEQTIVQEIFVSNGQEIPSDENFVVKSLHDAPAVSWKGNDLKKQEERYERETKRLKDDLESQSRRLGIAKEKAKSHADALMAFANKAEDTQLDTLKKFLSGEITHLYKGGYSPEIFEWADDLKSFDTDNDSWNRRVKVDGMKLVSLFGYSDGNLTYRLHTYRDGSGGSAEIRPATSYEEALEWAQADFDKQCADYLSGTNQNLYLETWQKIEGIVTPPGVVEKYEAAKNKAKSDRIARLRDELAKLEAE
ncbi:hypothetical protein NPS58_03845 [Pseudomonas putida]|uniref:hypothetical protein n=1 Tax=Pseudomonas putida TaxID=303 RepID=UPI00236406CD|nr:hypothetical protein [Pseudomonas putida]MDD2056578.1 hypothetical protein [Pseudomonas putida]